jgi:hypothetical protein
VNSEERIEMAVSERAMEVGLENQAMRSRVPLWGEKMAIAGAGGEEGLT